MTVGYVAANLAGGIVESQFRGCLFDAVFLGRQVDTISAARCCPHLRHLVYSTETRTTVRHRVDVIVGLEIIEMPD